MDLIFDRSGWSRTKTKAIRRMIDDGWESMHRVYAFELEGKDAEEL